MKYSEKYVFDETDIDVLGNIYPDKILKLFQKIATAHAQELGVGFDVMLEKGFLWVVTQIRYEVINKVKSGAQVELVTWPLPPTRIGFERQYLICDENGNAVVKGTSNWVVIDCVQRKLVSTENVYPNKEYCEMRNFDQRVRKLRDFDAEEKVKCICPDDKCIDRNGHVNNAEYAKFTVDAIGGLKGQLKAFQIDYIREVMCGQRVDVMRLSQQDKTLVKGLDEFGEKMFVCSFEY